MLYGIKVLGSYRLVALDQPVEWMLGEGQLSFAEAALTGVQRATVGYQHWCQHLSSAGQAAALEALPLQGAARLATTSLLATAAPVFGPTYGIITPNVESPSNGRSNVLIVWQRPAPGHLPKALASAGACAHVWHHLWCGTLGVTSGPSPQACGVLLVPQRGGMQVL